MLDSPDNSDGEEEEDDPVTVEDPTDEETVLLEVPPGLVSSERLQVMMELEEWGKLEEEQDFDFEEEENCQGQNPRNGLSVERQNKHNFPFG